jgi:hypothetical protein
MKVKRWSIQKRHWPHPEHDKYKSRTNVANFLEVYAKEIASLDSKTDPSVLSRRPSDDRACFPCSAFPVISGAIVVVDL